MYLEYDWTFDVFRPRFGNVFTSVRGERSWAALCDARAALKAAGLKLGKRTDTMTWAIETRD